MPLEKIVIPDNETPEQKEERLRKEREEAEAKAAEEAKRKAEEEEAKKKTEEEARKKAEEEAAKNQGEEDDSKIEIDGVLYSIDENGNAVDDSGNIKFTKNQIDAMEENDPNKLEDPDNYIDAISKASGIVIKDKEGKVVKYDATIEGFAKREADVKALGEQEGFAKGFNEFLNSNPDIASIIEYKRRFGTIEGYSKNVDYSKVEIKDDDSLLEDLIYKAEIQKGTSPERAKRIVEFAKANNSLKDDATESLNWLRKNQENEIRAIQEKREAEYKAELEKEIKFYGVSYENDGTVKVYNAPGSLYDLVVEKGQIGEYNLPKEGLKIQTESGEKLISRTELFDYFCRPVTEINGMVYSQAQVDEINRLSNPAELAMRFIMNLTGGIDQLIKNEISKKEIKRLRSLSSKTGKTTGVTRKVSKSKDDDKIVLPIK